MQKIKFYAQERFVIPDVENLQDFMEEDLQLYNTNYYTATSFIVSGFLTEVKGGLDIKVAIAGSTLFNSSGAIKSFYVGDAAEDQLEKKMDNNTTNYVHIELSRGTGSETSRAFWDPTLNNNEGGEFIQDVNTAEFLEVSLYVTQTGWSSDADKIPLAEVVTLLGAITTIKDRRDLFFRLERGDDPTYTYTLSTLVEDETDWSSADRQLETTKNWKDFVMTKFAKIQGTAYWWEDPPGSLASQLYRLTDGGVWAWTITAAPDITAFTVAQNAIVKNPETGATIGTFNVNGSLIGTFGVVSAALLSLGQVIELEDDNTAGGVTTRYVVTNIGAGPIVTVEEARLTFSANAYYVIIGTVNVNTIPFAGATPQSPITLGPEWVAYVDLDPTLTTDLVVHVVKDDDYINASTRFIVVRRYANAVYIG